MSTITTTGPTEGSTVPGTRVDWLYVRAYGGSGRRTPDAAPDTDPVVRVVADWVAGLGAQRWHFLRYFDVDGQHVRVRVRGDADAVDGWYRTLPDLDRALADCRSEDRERVLHDPVVTLAGSRRGTSLGVYSPEIGKYGEGSALAAAEDHFDASSTWCARHQVWRWSTATRVAAAVHYLGGLADGLDTRSGVATAPGAGEALLELHRRHWLPRLRAAGVDNDRLGAAQRAVLAADHAAQEADPIMGPAAELVASHLDTGLAARHELTDPARSFHLAHMDLNRLGINPVEECLAGLIARALRARGSAQHTTSSADRKGTHHGQ